jgi:glycerol-3-phosphate acyltransferase PlsX
VKSHGGADVLAYTSAIREAMVEVDKNVPERISKHVEEAMTKRQTA